MTEGWILAGVLDGVLAYPRLTHHVCGIPHVLRLACDLASAGARCIYIVWNADGPPPDLSAIATDPRLRARLEVVRTPPDGDAHDTILVARADRLFHRDLPKLVVRGAATLGKIRGDQHDAVFAAPRTVARCLATRAREPGGIARAIAGLSVAEASVPYAGFTAPVSDLRSLRRAEGQLVSSLRKAADGLAARAINRHLSLPLTRLLARTPIHPNHITFVALVLALAGAVTISRGGYVAGVVGMLLVELGSIVDGCDGELARLRFQFSRTGQWLDTTVDDLANVAYITGITASLAETSWAIPVGAVGLGAFLTTQLVQYALIAFVFESGDLAANPWALQTGNERSVLPKLLKRDFVVTLFVVFAVLGRLDWILLVFASGAVVFFVVFFAQFIRHGFGRGRAGRRDLTPRPPGRTSET